MDLLDKKKLNKLDISALNRIIKKERVNLPRVGRGKNQSLTKKDLVEAIIENRHFKNIISDIPKDLKYLIGKILSPDSVANFCQSNKEFRSQCFNNSFWSYYLLANDTTESQERLHDLLVGLAGNGDIELFAHIWNEDIKVHGKELIKERRTLLSSYDEAILNEKKMTKKFIWNIDPDWLDEIIDKILNISTYGRRLLKIYRNTILIQKDIDNDSVCSKYYWHSMYNDEVVYIYLSKTKKFRQPPCLWERVHKHDYPEILAKAAYYGNIELFEDMYSILDITMNREIIQNRRKIMLGLLQSSNEEGVKMYLKIKNKTHLDHDDIDEASYNIRNRNVLLEYLKKHPEDKYECMLSSFETLTDHDIITIIESMGVSIYENKHYPQEVIDRAYEYGRDYLGDYIVNITGHVDPEYEPW